MVRRREAGVRGRPVQGGAAAAAACGGGCHRAAGTAEPLESSESGEWACFALLALPCSLLIWDGCVADSRRVRVGRRHPRRKCSRMCESILQGGVSVWMQSECLYVRYCIPKQISGFGSLDLADILSLSLLIARVQCAGCCSVFSTALSSLPLGTSNWYGSETVLGR